MGYPSQHRPELGVHSQTRKHKSAKGQVLLGNRVHTCPFSSGDTLPMTSNNFPICRWLSAFNMRAISPLPPHVRVPLAPSSAVTVPRRRTVYAVLDPGGAQLKASRCCGRMRGVCGIVFIVANERILDSVLDSCRQQKV